MKLLIQAAILFLSAQQVFAQTCKTNAELETVPGKYLTAAQYPWPAVKAEYFKNMTTASDKAMAKQILGKIETIEQQSHAGFNLTGGNWENYYATNGYGYLGNNKLGIYYFQSSLHEFFCLNGKPKRNDEAGTILRIHVNSLSLNTLNRFLDQPFGSSIGEYDFRLQFLDWKSHKSVNVNDPLISLFNYFTCNNNQLLEAINTSNDYFQDVADKEIKPNNRNNYIYRYWFVKKKDIPVLIPVSRKEYLQSLLEYYEREKLYFPKLMNELKGSSGAKQYSTWEADVADKIAVVQKALHDHDEEWLSKPAVINRMEDASQTYKAGLKERTNYNRFWKFYNNENKSQPLYKYNTEYFKTASFSAKPQIITVVFRYVTVPSSLKLVNNFTKGFNFDALRKLMD